MLDGLVLVVSGYNGGIHDHSQVLDIKAETTCSLPPAGVSYPFKMNTGVGTTIDGIPLICGGYAGGSGGRLKQCYKFDELMNAWALHANMVTGREAPAAAVLNGKLWVTGKLEK